MVELLREIALSYGGVPHSTRSSLTARYYQRSKEAVLRGNIMRVLQLSRRFSDSGVTTHMLSLAGGLAEKGVDVALLAGEPEIENALRAQRLPKAAIHHAPFAINPLAIRTVRDARGEFRAFRRLNALVREFRPDILHVHWRSLSPYARFVESRYGIPFVTSLHLVGIPSSLPTRLVSFWGAAAVAPSTEAGNDLRRNFGLPLTRIRLIHYGFDETFFRPPTPQERRAARSFFGLRTDGFVACAIGSINSRKRQDLLIEALGALKRREISLEALIAGRPTFERDLETTVLEPIARYDLQDSVKILGFVDPRQVFWASDVLVLPSEQEAFPSVVVEAMLCGVVPIRTPAGGERDQIEDGVNGFIVPRNDAETIAERMNRLIADSQLHAMMREAAVRKAKNEFTTRIMATKTLSLYQEVLQIADRAPYKTD